MAIDCKIFPNINAANGALNAAHNAWTPPTQSAVGNGRHVAAQDLPAQRISEPEEMVDGRFCVWADHPSFKGDSLSRGQIKRHVFIDEAPGLQAVGAESGVVARPGNAKERSA